MQFRSAIVTGGAGFIGSHLVDALVAQGVQVTVIDKQDAAADRANAKADYARLQVQDAGVQAVFDRVRPDVLFHLAAHIDDRESLRKPVENAEDNILGSLNVFEAARLVNVKKIVFASTGVVYGNVTELPTNEAQTPKPLTPYAVSKLTGERYLHFYWLLYTLSYVALRLSNVYGPRQDSSRECGVIAIATGRLLASQPVYRNNDGETTRDYVYVDDVVSAFLAAAQSEATGVYNISTGSELSTNAVLNKVAKALGVQAQPVPRPDIEDRVKRVALDNTKAKHDLAWSPTFTIDDGLARTVAWYRSHTSTIHHSPSTVLPL